MSPYISVMQIQHKYNAHVEKLHKILNVDVDKAAPAPMNFFPDALGALSILTAIASTPVVLWSLFRLKRFGWLLAFFLVVIAPFFLIHLLASGTIWNMVLIYLPVLNLALYYFFLRITIPEWKEPLFINRAGSDFD